MDLKFPHHDCEIAQCVGTYGKEPVYYWMHTNMLTVKGQKMSKSLQVLPWYISNYKAYNIFHLASCLIGLLRRQR